MQLEISKFKMFKSAFNRILQEIQEFQGELARAKIVEKLKRAKIP
jgi:hypothetical protein